MKITLLGTGSSGGVPLITGDWGACDPSNPKNQRLRVSVLIEFKNGKNLLIDTSPDLRQQLLRQKIDKIDAILLTHAHADHVGGMDELRQLYIKNKTVMPVFALPSTLNEVKCMFRYIFETLQEGYPAFLKAEPITGRFEWEGITIEPFEQNHGNTACLGYKIGDFAYSTDVKTLPERSKTFLKNIPLWVVDALRYKEHPTHSHLKATLELIKELTPKKAVLTHMTHEMDYDTLVGILPKNVEPGYDGLSFEMDGY